MTSSADESQGADPLFVLAGGGELGERIRAFDWSATSLGPIAGWPDSLCSALSICLQASVPCALYWGADLVLLYNDPWGSLPGVTPADCLGRPAREVWGERWPMLEPVFHRVLTLNETVRGPALPVSIPGQDFLEPGAFDELWSPVRSRSGAVEGVFHTVLDLTDRKRAAERERQLLIEAATANAQFRALFEQGALFAGIMHVDGTLLEPNRLALEACGYTREQVVGRPFWDCPW
jgi:PAS domain-containing protein